MNGWRPEGWTVATGMRLYKGKLLSSAREAYEAGADAMLESLKKKGAWMTPEQMKLLAPDRQHPYGYIVFIPEEKAGDG